MAGKALFVYSPDHAYALKLALSDARFQRYLDASNDETDALNLYTWNTAISSAFYGPLQACEITLRNSVNRNLGGLYGQLWFNNTTLRGEELRMAQGAKVAIERVGKEATPGRIIAELGFGYWVGLFAKAYDETLWRLALYKAFPRGTKRGDVFSDLDRLRTLRNRIAHQEPIFQRVLLDDYRRILTLLGRLSPEVREWVEHHSRVADTLAVRPSADSF